MEKKSRINQSLDIKKFIEGECFICKEKTKDPEAYLHQACAEAYWEEKEKRRKNGRALDG